MNAVTVSSPRPTSAAPETSAIVTVAIPPALLRRAQLLVKINGDCFDRVVQTLLQAYVNSGERLNGIKPR